MANYNALEPTPDDMDALPGALDNSVVLQRWLDRGGVLRLNRNYFTSKPLFYQGKTFIKGVHPVLTGIYATPSLPVDAGELLRNKTPKSEIEVTVDNWIRFENIGIGGPIMSPETDRKEFCFAAIGVEGLELVNFVVQDWRRGGIGLNNVKKFGLSGIDILRYGSLTEPDWSHPDPCKGYDGGVGLWISPSCQKGTVEKVFIREGEWSAAEISGYDLSIRNWIIKNVKECGIFSGPTNTIFDDVRVFNVKEKVCSAHGFETGGFKNKLINCLVDGADKNGILLTTPNEYICTNNTLVECNRKPTDEPAGFITVRTVGSYFQTRYLQMTGNVIVPSKEIVDRRKKSPYAIAMNNYSEFPEEKKFVHCDLRGNNAGEDQDWKKGVLKWDAKDMGECCYS